jgi:hypothetical protein
MIVFFPFFIGDFLPLVSWIPSCDGMTEDVALTLDSGVDEA